MPLYNTTGLPIVQKGSVDLGSSLIIPLPYADYITILVPKLDQTDSGVSLTLSASTDNGSTYITGGGNSVRNVSLTSSNTVTTESGTNAVTLITNLGLATGNFLKLELFAFNYSSQYKNFLFSASTRDSVAGTYKLSQGIGNFEVVPNITTIKIAPSAGTFSSRYILLAGSTA